MNEPDPQADRTLEMAARVALILEGLGVPCALIGAAALAVHGYRRATLDIDLAVATDPFSVLREAQRLIASTLSVEATLVTPDAEDPLGGVFSITGEGFDPGRSSTSTTRSTRAEIQARRRCRPPRPGPSPAPRSASSTSLTSWR